MHQDIALDFLGPCNYTCWYCTEGGKGHLYPVPHLHDLAKLRQIYEALGARGETYTSLFARGTEPCLHPQTADIVSICAQSGTVWISTNLSRSVGEWLPGPKGVHLHITIHPEAEADLAGFSTRLREAVDLGYDIEAQALSDKDRPDLRELVEKAGVVMFRVPPVRPSTHAGQINAELPPLPKIAVCRCGYDTFFIPYPTELRRCRILSLLLPEILDAPGPCLSPQRDYRCHSYLVKE